MRIHPRQKQMINLLEKAGVAYIPANARGWVQVRCPYCGDGSRNGGLNPALKIYSCWRCGWHDFYATLAKITGVPALEVRYVLGDARALLPSVKTHAKTLDFPFAPLRDAEKWYLEKRGFNADALAEKYDLRSGGCGGRWAGRIIIPIYRDGVIVSYQGRTIIADEKLRYLTLSDADSIVSAKSTLYNLDNARSDYVVIVEGVADVWRMGDGFVSPFGSDLTAAQIALLAKRFSRVVFAFDSEATAQAKARKNALSVAALGVACEVADPWREFGANDAGDLNACDAEKICEKIIKI